jgi:hypothetical protein
LDLASKAHPGPQVGLPIFSEMIVEGRQNYSAISSMR